MKIETVKRDEAGYIFIDSVTEDVVERVLELSGVRQKFCITEINAKQAKSLVAKLEQVGYSCTAIPVQTEAETIVGGNSIGGYLRLYFDPPQETKSL